MVELRKIVAMRLAALTVATGMGIAMTQLSRTRCGGRPYGQANCDAGTGKCG
jgi:hypothetical protein